MSSFLFLITHWIQLMLPIYAWCGAISQSINEKWGGGHTDGQWMVVESMAGNITGEKHKRSKMEWEVSRTQQGSTTFLFQMCNSHWTCLTPDSCLAVLFHTTWRLLSLELQSGNARAATNTMVSSTKLRNSIQCVVFCRVSATDRGCNFQCGC